MANLANNVTSGDEKKRANMINETFLSVNTILPKLHLGHDLGGDFFSDMISWKIAKIATIVVPRHYPGSLPHHYSTHQYVTYQ